MYKAFNRILVIQTASIGDVVLATPVIEQLHRAYPDARIDFLLKKGIEDVFKLHPFLNEVIVWDKSKRKYRNLFRILKHIRKNQYSLVVNIQRFFTTGLITALSGARLKAGFDKNPFSWMFTQKIRHTIGSQDEAIHETSRNLQLIGNFTTGNSAMKLYPADQDRMATEKWTGAKFITVSPASLWFTKQLPVEKWQEFIQSLDPDINVYLLGSKSDITLCDHIVNYNSDRKVVNLAGKLSFLQSAALMERAMMNYTNDSAPMHLASAVNAPVAAVFCSTVPAFGFGPLSDKSFVIETEEKLACRPCGLHGKNDCPEKHFKCATTIPVSKLLSIVQNG